MKSLDPFALARLMRIVGHQYEHGPCAPAHAHSLSDVRFHASCADGSASEFLPLIDVVTASVVDACYGRVDILHEPLSAVLSAVALQHGRNVGGDTHPIEHGAGYMLPVNMLWATSL